jgi:hypothetical protein
VAVWNGVTIGAMGAAARVAVCAGVGAQRVAVSNGPRDARGYPGRCRRRACGRRTRPSSTAHRYGTTRLFSCAFAMVSRLPWRGE